MKDRQAIKNCIDVISAMYQLNEINATRKSVLVNLLKENEVKTVLEKLRDDHPTFFNMVDEDVVSRYNL